MAKKTTDSSRGETTRDSSPDAEHQKPAIGIMLELEFMLFPGRQLMYEAFASVLHGHQIALDELLFSRYCFQRTVEKNLSALLHAMEKKDLAVEDMSAKIKRKFESALNAASCGPVPALLALLQKAVENNIKVGLLSFLPEENARQLMARLSLNETACLHVMQKKADDLPTPDSWLSLLKAAALSPRRAVALVDSARAARSALAVGMRCVVLPGSFTAWHDFGGADIVLENISDLKLNDIVALLTPCHFRGGAK